jgi:hypothetical protein
MTEADRILTRVYTKLKINGESDEFKYGQINNIVQELERVNNTSTISPKTTGTISERLCELALKTKVPATFKRISDEWNWMADFSILGHPFNLLVSVKSFKAKERLLVSGSGNNLSPTVGWGLFNDKNEWTANRTKIYLFRSFIAIYMPSQLYRELPRSSKAIKNINAKPFLRRIDNFMDDIETTTHDGIIDISKF